MEVLILLIQINIFLYIVVMVLDSVRLRNFYFLMVAWVKVIIFRAVMRSFVHIDHIKKDILILGFGPTQGLDHTTLTAEGQY